MKTAAEATTRFQMAPGDTTVGSRPHSVAHDERSNEDETIHTMFLSDEAKNRLMFYGRQDTAHGLGNTITLLRKVNRLILLVKVLIFAVVVIGLAVLYELATRH